MKKIFTITINLFLIIALLSATSCNKKEGCTDPLADNFDPSAELENNTCINAREKFVGVYLAYDNCAFVQKNYVVEILKSNSNLTDILIYNIHNLSAMPVKAKVTGSSFVIRNQNISQTRRIEGSGSILGNVIQLNFLTKVGTGPNTPQNFEICQSTFTK